MKCVECFKSGNDSVAEFNHMGKSICQDHLQESIIKAKALIEELDSVVKSFGETNVKFQDTLRNMQIEISRFENLK